MKLGALLEATKIAVPEGAAAIDIRQIAYDSRKAKEGALFVAIPGFHRDGHGFAKDAVGRGAVVVLAEHAIDVGVPAPVLTTALYSRFASRGLDEFADKLLSAMRKEFGGHEEKTA